jgi:hypothetical protein
MTDHDDKPSFLARLAIVVTFGVLPLQFFGGIVAQQERKTPGSAASLVGLLLLLGLPLLAHSAVAGIYYLFKGAPTNADNVVKSRLLYVWVISYIQAGIFLFKISHV